MLHEIKGQQLILHVDRYMFWQNQRTLILSDLHLGKATHFRKHGIQAPLSILRQEINRMEAMIVEQQPSKIIIVGDLFHSDLNHEWRDFENLVARYAHIQWHLVRGNHDSIPTYILKWNGMQVATSIFMEPFVFTHKPTVYANHYAISGHVHPGVVLSGKGKQQIKLPCFYFGAKYALLPAFGNFTGMEVIQPEKNDHVYGITQSQVIALHP